MRYFPRRTDFLRFDCRRDIDSDRFDAPLSGFESELKPQNVVQFDRQNRHQGRFRFFHSR